MHAPSADGAVKSRNAMRGRLPAFRSTRPGGWAYALSIAPVACAYYAAAARARARLPGLRHRGAVAAGWARTAMLFLYGVQLWSGDLRRSSSLAATSQASVPL